jgi:hypothetical protein
MSQIIEVLIHLAAFFTIFLPLFVLLRIRSREYSKVIGLKSRNEIIKSLTPLVLGLVPLALIHLLGALSYFGINVLPPEHTFFHLVISHIVLVIAFLSITWFLLKFEQKFIEVKTNSR